MLSMRLRSLRAEKKLLQKDVADQINITASAYGFYEQGKRMPDTDTLEKLADFFGVSVDYLLGRTNIRLQAEKLLQDSAGIKNITVYHYVSQLPPEAHEELAQYIGYLKHKYSEKGK